jgi:hypothetical protein
MTDDFPNHLGPVPWIDRLGWIVTGIETATHVAQTDDFPNHLWACDLSKRALFYISAIAGHLSPPTFDTGHTSSQWMLSPLEVVKWRNQLFLSKN